MLPDRLRQFRERHALTEYRLLRRVARRAGYQLVRAGYYSPIPDVDELPGAVWQEPDEMPGLEWDLDAQLDHIERHLIEFLPEFTPPLNPEGTPQSYHYGNEFFNAVDADVLYAMIRWLRPARYLEMGSGYSTLVAAAAAERNRAHGHPLHQVVFDPFPSPVIEPVRDTIDLHPLPAEEIPLAAFTALAPGDILFIDSTHTVRPGGDVVWLVLGVLPRLAAGVVVHLHDFFRPFEYPREWLERFGAYWQEHHLVQALLADSRAFEILSAHHALSRLRREAVQRTFAGLQEDMQPSSLWLRRRA